MRRISRNTISREITESATCRCEDCCLRGRGRPVPVIYHGCYMPYRFTSLYDDQHSAGSSPTNYTLRDELRVLTVFKCRSQWPRGLRRRSTAACLLRSWVRIPPGAWIFVCCECCVLSGRGLCDGLIIRSEESYRLWRVVVCDHETSQARRLKPARGL